MRFGRTHRLLTSALAIFGALSALLSGALPRVTTVLLFTSLVLAIFVPERFQNSPAARWLSAGLPSAMLAFEFLRFVGGAPLIDLSIEFAIALQIVRLATRRGASHDQQVILLALLHLVAGTVLGGGLAYGMCLIGFLVLAPGALVLSHLRREVEGNYRQGARDRTGLPVDVPRILRSRRVIGPGFLALTSLLAVPILVFTLLLFLAFPRVGLSLLLFSSRHGIRSVGFSDKVDLREVGTLRTDPSIALRFRRTNQTQPPPSSMVLRLRGTAFDDYRSDGNWTRTETAPTVLPRVGGEVPLLRQPRPTDEVISIELEPFEHAVLFLPPRAVALRWANTTAPQGLPVARTPNVLRSAENTYRYDTVPDHVQRYDVFVAPPGEAFDDPLTDRDRLRYTKLPSTLPSRIRELALTWTTGATTDAQRAARIAQRLEADYRYTMTAPSGGQLDPIDHFLFVSHAGHCEFFSSAMTLLLRSLNIPARNVGGYVGGTYNRFGGFYAVRQGDAHSWVEAYIQGTWTTFDPTPADGARPIADRGGNWSLLRELFEAMQQGWDRFVINYDLPTQLSLLRRMRRSLGPSTPNFHFAPTVTQHAPRFAVLRIVGLSVAALLVLLLVGVFVYRRLLRQVPTTDPRLAARARIQQTATQLWQAIEDTLALHGYTRPRNTPPLRFVEDVRAKRHDAIGDELHLLTQIYLAARFGSLELTTADQRDLQRRLVALRRDWQ